MPEQPAAGLDLGQLLAAVEDAPPVAAADVVGGVLAEVTGASGVSFLIADFSGGALVRLGHTPAPTSEPPLRAECGHPLEAPPDPHLAPALR